jgi:hypothetical protein
MADAAAREADDGSVGASRPERPELIRSIRHVPLVQSPEQGLRDSRARRLKMSRFSSPRLAGRGRVRGLGEWPHLFNCAPVLQMTTLD